MLIGSSPSLGFREKSDKQIPPSLPVDSILLSDLVESILLHSVARSTVLIEYLQKWPVLPLWQASLPVRVGCGARLNIDVQTAQRAARRRGGSGASARSQEPGARLSRQAGETSGGAGQADTPCFGPNPY